MVVMLVFVLIVLLEMLVSAFRGTKTNIARLISNIISVLIAGGITLLISKFFTKTFTDLTSTDLTFDGIIAKGTADKLDIILSSFAEGVALSVLFSLLYLIIKVISILITKVVVKDDCKKGFKPAGIIFGLIIGLICAGFVLMPFTGLQQIFTDKKTANAVTGLVSENAGETAGAFTRIAVGPEAERVSRFTGIGIITNRVFNILTTAETDSGKECLAEFVPPYLEKIGDVMTIAEEDNPLSERVYAGASALDAFSKTKLFKEKEKVSILEDAIKNAVPELSEFPEYKSISDVSADLSYLGNIIGIFEKAAPGKEVTDLLNSGFEDIEISDSDIEKLADNLYAMNAGEYYVNLILTNVFSDERSHFAGSDFQSTKPAFVSLIKTAMNLKNVVVSDELDEETLRNEFEELRDSGLLTDEDLEDLINRIKDDPAAADIPDDVFDDLLNGRY